MRKVEFSLDQREGFAMEVGDRVSVVADSVFKGQKGEIVKEIGEGVLKRVSVRLDGGIVPTLFPVNQLEVI